MMIYLGDSFVCCNCNWKQDQHINHELKTIKWKSKAFLIVSIQVKMLYYLEDSVGRQYFSSNFPVSEDNRYYMQKIILLFRLIFQVIVGASF